MTSRMLVCAAPIPKAIDIQLQCKDVIVTYVKSGLIYGVHVLQKTKKDDRKMYLTRFLALKHPSFNARTVFVQNGNVDEACRIVNRILGKEGLLEQFRLTRYYEKPFQTRRRINYEKCKSIYNEDMSRKIQFVLRKNRHEPYPGCH